MNNKIQYAVYKRETGNASGKAKSDALDILLSMGFDLSYHPSDKRKIRVIQQFLSMHKFKNKDYVVVQYPALADSMLSMLFKYLPLKGKSIALIHDLVSIQGVNNNGVNEEIGALNHFNVLIVHNRNMATYLLDNGYKGKMVCLELFDYLHDFSRKIHESPFSNTVSFAGNLTKGKFIYDLEKIGKCQFKLYGSLGDGKAPDAKNVSYMGLLPSDEIVYKMEGDYGLIWDGDSVETCSGETGRYLLYNNPHKLSLCIAAGKPVITWKKAAISDFVETNDIGIAVESLEELNEIDLSEHYSRMKNNVLSIKKEIAQGKYLERALNSAMQA